MRQMLGRLLDAPRVRSYASAISLALGLFFVFIWAPHPWGWQGIDQYHDLAVQVARGEPFGTTDVPWGYAYFVAACYVIVGEHPLVPVLLQVAANATVPLMLFHLVRRAAGQRTAALASLLAGIFSFNTVYASTQASDALCTVLFLGSLLSFAIAHETRGLVWWVLSGVLSGLVPQFRPNMIAFPVVLAVAYWLVDGKTRHAALSMGVLLAMTSLALAPWVVRNYRLTGEFLPTSTHGGVQLWYGTLQVGPYLESRAHNPRSAFEPAPFDYTSLAKVPIIVSIHPGTCAALADRSRLRLVYWTDRDTRHLTAQPLGVTGDSQAFAIPGQPAPTALYYFFEAEGDEPGSPPVLRQVTPTDPHANPFIFFVAEDHLGDLDRHDDLLDIFDLIRLMRYLAWGDRPDHATAVDLDRDGRLGPDDLETAVLGLLGNGTALAPAPRLEPSATAVSLRLSDGSSLTVPRAFSGRVTDLDVQPGLASRLIPARRVLGPDATPATPAGQCTLGDVRVNEVFYRKEPHQMRRYIALAADNIRRDPMAYLAASAYRLVRLFVLRGTTDQSTAQQFAGSRLVYLGGLVLSGIYFCLFVAGAVIARTRSRGLLVFLIPIVYVPVTICFVLTNMRYTITVQPLMFAFVALTLVVLGRFDVETRDGGDPHRA